MTSSLQLSTLIVAIMLHVSIACQPPDYSGYDSWSTVTVVDGKVTIDRKVLLDQNPNQDYQGIVIESNGILAFKYDVTGGILLRTEYIHIKDGGEMKIGDKACGYSGSLEIELLGERNPGYNIQDFGDKFIGVGNGGKLSIYGEQKVTWTRLTKTIPKIDPAGVFFNDSVTQDDDNLQGLLVYHFAPTETDFSNVNADEFKFRVRSEKKFNETVEDLNEYLSGLPSDHIVVFAIRKSLMAQDNTMDFKPVFDIMETFLGLQRSLLRDLKFYDGYVAYKNGVVSREETSVYRLNGLHQRCSLTEFVGTLKIYIESYTRIKAHGRSYINLQVTNRALSEPIMEVKGTKLNWKKGDKILIAATNGFNQHEYASITEVVEEDKIFKIDLTAIHEHQCKNYKGVPICAEVALINQNVVIRGVTGGEDLYGGHLKAVKGFAACHLRNVEFELMGQQQPLGRYPVHFHLVGDVEDKATVDSLSIHNSYARCVTVHRTNNLRVQNTVCVDCLGHQFFLEDGDEIGNSFVNNLAMLARKPDGRIQPRLIPSDKDPNAFHITHPRNSLEGNVAVGSEGRGFHFVFPVEPLGDSPGLNGLEPGDASRTAIELFNGNTAHHNKQYGLRIDDYLDKDGNVKGMMSGYNPRNDPKDPASSLVPTHLTCFTGYGNGIANVHLRAAELLVSQFRLAKSRSSIVILRGLKQERYEQKVEDSVILGDREDANQAEDDSDTASRVGIAFTGPVTLKNIYFDDFYKSNVYDSGAIGFAEKNNEPISQNKMESDIFFGFSDPAGNRMLKPDTDEDRLGNDVESFRDNGDVTDSSSPVTVLRDTSFHLTGNCYIRKNWGPYAICNEDYAMMRIMKVANVARVSHTGTVVTLDPEGDLVPQNTPFNVVLNRFHYHYIFSFDKDDFDFSKALNLRTFKESMDAIVGFCVPKDADLRIKSNGIDSSNSVASYFELAQKSTELQYFHNKPEGILFLNLGGGTCKSDFDLTGICRAIDIKVKNGKTGNNDCNIAQYKPIAPPTTSTREVESETRELETKAKDRLIDLIERLIALETDNTDETLKRRRRSVDSPNRVFLPNIAGKPNDLGTCDV